jgi:predicted nucleic acid-binding Zn ribbon protein
VERRCLDCGDVLRGRADKKFCSDQCRNNYNNRLNRDANSYVRNIHLLLRRNRRILADLHADGRTRVHRDALSALGFSFNFFTHTIETKGGVKYRYCYEYGICITGDDFAEISFNSEILDYN